MADNSKIEWTDATWNPVIGCTKVGDGCVNCYPIKDANRLSGNPKGNLAELYSGLTHVINGKLTWTGVVKTVLDRLDQPLHWRTPRRIFVNSMSDLFHEDVPFEFVDKVFAVMAVTPHHAYQVLTKRPERMLRYVSERASMPLVDMEAYLRGLGMLWKNIPSVQFPLPNVWLGTSIEDQPTADRRVPILQQVPAALRFLSIEPLLGPLTVRRYLMGGENPGRCGNCGRGHGFDRCPNYGGIAKQSREWRCSKFRRVDFSIHWVIAGGESGPGARPLHPAWVRGLRDQCDAACVPFFFKQWGEYRSMFGVDDKWFAEKVGKKRAGAVLDGREWRQFPEAARAR